MAIRPSHWVTPVLTHWVTPVLTLLTIKERQELIKRKFRKAFFLVSHFRLQGFIELSCQQDHPLGDPQQDIFLYFYRENLHRNETSHANISDGFGFFRPKTWHAFVF